MTRKATRDGGIGTEYFVEQFYGGQRTIFFHLRTAPDKENE
jgi:hypothetical protein